LTWSSPGALPKRSISGPRGSGALMAEQKWFPGTTCIAPQVAREHPHRYLAKADVLFVVNEQRSVPAVQ